MEKSLELQIRKPTNRRDKQKVIVSTEDLMRIFANLMIDQILDDKEKRLNVSTVVSKI